MARERNRTNSLLERYDVAGYSVLLSNHATNLVPRSLSYFLLREERILGKRLLQRKERRKQICVTQVVLNYFNTARRRTVINTTVIALVCTRFFNTLFPCNNPTASRRSL